MFGICTSFELSCRTDEEQRWMRLSARQPHNVCRTVRVPCLFIARNEFARSTNIVNVIYHTLVEQGERPSKYSNCYTPAVFNAAVTGDSVGISWHRLVRRKLISWGWKNFDVIMPFRHDIGRWRTDGQTPFGSKFRAYAWQRDRNLVSINASVIS